MILYPGQENVSFSVTTPSSRQAAEVMILKVDPGSYTLRRAIEEASGEIVAGGRGVDHLRAALGRNKRHLYAALTVRKHRLEGKNPISEADLEWIFACNYEGTE